MSILDKLKFWKKKEPFPDLNLDLGKGGYGKDSTAGLGGTGEMDFKPTDISLRGPGAGGQGAAGSLLLGGAGDRPRPTGEGEADR